MLFAFIFSSVVIFYCSYAIWLIIVKRKRYDFFIVSILVLIMVSMIAKIIFKAERVNKANHDFQQSKANDIIATTATDINLFCTNLAQWIFSSQYL